MEQLLAKVRVSALAKDLGIDSKQLIQVLHTMGEYVKTASSTLEAPVVRKVYEHFGRSGPSTLKTGSPPSHPSPISRPRPQQNNPWKEPEERARDGDIDYFGDGRRWYTTPPSLQQRGHHPFAPSQGRAASGGPPAAPPSTPPRPSSRRKPDDLDWAAEVFDRNRSELRRAAPDRPKRGEPKRERLSPDDLKWVELFLDLSAKQVWVEAGLRPRDAELARECADNGLSPHYLSRLVGSNPVWWWITEGGQSPAWVVKQMRLRRGGQSSTG